MNVPARTVVCIVILLDPGYEPLVRPDDREPYTLRKYWVADAKTKADLRVWWDFSTLLVNRGT